MLACMHNQNSQEFMTGVNVSRNTQATMARINSSLHCHTNYLSTCLVTAEEQWTRLPLLSNEDADIAVCLHFFRFFLFYYDNDISDLKQLE